MAADVLLKDIAKFDSELPVEIAFSLEVSESAEVDSQWTDFRWHELGHWAEVTSAVTVKKRATVQRVVGVSAQLRVRPHRTASNYFVFLSEGCGISSKMGIDDLKRRIPRNMLGGQLAVMCVEECRVEESRALYGACPYQLGSADVVPQGEAENVCIPAWDQALQWPITCSLGKQGNRSRHHLKVGDLPRQLLAGLSEHKITQVSVVKIRVVQSVICRENCLEIIVSCVGAIELCSVR